MNFIPGEELRATRGMPWALFLKAPTCSWKFLHFSEDSVFAKSKSMKVAKGLKRPNNRVKLREQGRELELPLCKGVFQLPSWRFLFSFCGGGEEVRLATKAKLGVQVLFQHQGCKGNSACE